MTKKLLALLAAGAMAFSAMAVTAFAEEKPDDEEEVTVGDDVEVDVDDEDTNPTTGAVLAAMPIVLAGAAAVVAKKRN